MSPKSVLSLSALALLALALAGCLLSHRHPFVVVQQPSVHDPYGHECPSEAPPALRDEVCTPAPSPVHVWVAGHWGWRHGRYVWVDGCWLMPTRRGALWVSGRWEHSHGRYMWVEGRWD